jgi:hypothetical protein
MMRTHPAAQAATTALLGAVFGVLLAACSPAQASPTVSPPSATPSPTTPTATIGPTPSVTVLGPCSPSSLTARVTLWDAAAGHRIATVELVNTGSVACTVRTEDRPQLVDGAGTVLIDGDPPAVSPALTLDPGGKLTTLVQDANYCLAAPVAPVTVAFVLPDGVGAVVATPLSPTDTSGVPPCNGDPGSAGDIEMQPWAP